MREWCRLAQFIRCIQGQWPYIEVVEGVTGLRTWRTQDHGASTFHVEIWKKFLRKGTRGVFIDEKLMVRDVKK